jgi:succinate dehydrogenase / fumarate reductase, cytochrome b subunit
MAKRERPLSPFMNYRWQYTNTLSILHRLTGIFLAFGLVALVYWLAALAAGPERYSQAQAVLVSPLGSLALVAWSLSFFYHFLNGIRHLFWDVGYGFELKVARASGWAAFIGALVLTAVFWIVIALKVGGGAA